MQWFFNLDHSAETGVVSEQICDEVEVVICEWMWEDYNSGIATLLAAAANRTDTVESRGVWLKAWCSEPAIQGNFYRAELSLFLGRQDCEAMCLSQGGDSVSAWI